jgi:hypothetical protein
MYMLAPDLSMPGKAPAAVSHPFSPDLPGSCLQRVEVDQPKVIYIVKFS